MNLRSTLLGSALVVFWACVNDAFPEPPPEEPSLSRATGADDPGSCAACHPRQFSEWAGSSHNYGGGIDPGYQSLEMAANFTAAHRAGRPIFRQTLLCIGCHAPSAAGHVGGVLNPNSTFRAEQNGVRREIAAPADDQDLLLPPSRATESQTASDVDMSELFSRRRLTYEGISCDTCHKSGRPFDDLHDEDAGQACADSTPECAAILRAQCEAKDDARCRRISREGHHASPDRFERGIANFALRYESEGAMRFGPFAFGDANPATAHDVSDGADTAAQQYRVSFPGEEKADVRPYLKTGQFCGACHDVRLSPPDDLATPRVEAEPIHNEPFLRLENLFTEWYLSPLNLHPASDLRNNPYLDDEGKPRRIVCQDCHMSLFPFAPPGTFPGAYTNGDACDELGRCGLTIAEEQVDGVSTTRHFLRVQKRSRVTTHNMTGVDIGLGDLAPSRSLLNLSGSASLPASLALPNQQEGQAEDADASYGLPVTLDARRRQQLANAAAISLAGTPQTIDPGDRDCSDGACCDDSGLCNLPVKAWLTNVNGGHNVAAGFSQERQVWVELTVQDLGRKDPTTGISPVIDCALGDLRDFYLAEELDDDRYPRFEDPVPHDALGAEDVVDRLFGVDGATQDGERACRGLSGHLLDKPHDETHEPIADGRLDDEDVLLHRIGNTLPEFEDGTRLISWHVLDYGLDESDAARPIDGARVARDDQFHVVGNDPYRAQLSRKTPDPAVADASVTTFDPQTGRKDSVPLRSLGALRFRVTDTSEEREEILYPFPELEPLLPHLDAGGHLHPGERFGLSYATNIFYRVAGCPLEGDKSCEGPEELDGMKAQVPWLMTYPTLPHARESEDPETLHFAGEREKYSALLAALGMPNGTTASEAFTFIPLNANHMPNNRSLKFYQPQRHYWDIRVRLAEVVGPIRVSARLYYRHFPPEFLRLMARSSAELYARASALGRADDVFPHGPLIVEGREDSARWPETGNIDRVFRVEMDRAVAYVGVGSRHDGDPRIAIPEAPTFERDVRPILRDNCLPCHGDVLRHGGLVLDYDRFPGWDDPGIGAKAHAEQSPILNLIGRPSRRLGERLLVVPGSSATSFLMDVLTRDRPDPDHDLIRRMPLGTDALSPRDVEVIRRWIDHGTS